MIAIYIIAAVASWLLFIGLILVARAPDEPVRGDPTWAHAFGLRLGPIFLSISSWLMFALFYGLSGLSLTLIGATDLATFGAALALGGVAGYANHRLIVRLSSAG